MSDRQRDAKLLARAEADILEGERRLDRQTVLIEQLRENGQATAELERSLLRLEAATTECKARRDTIRQRIEPSAQD